MNTLDIWKYNLRGLLDFLERPLIGSCDYCSFTKVFQKYKGYHLCGRCRSFRDDVLYIAGVDILKDQLPAGNYKRILKLISNTGNDEIKERAEILLYQVENSKISYKVLNNELEKLIHLGWEGEWEIHQRCF